MAAVEARKRTGRPHGRTDGRAGAALWGPRVILSLAGLYFLFPLAATFWFSLHNKVTAFNPRPYLDFWKADGFWAAFRLSVEISVLTVAMTLLLMIPTMLLVHLRFQRLRPVVEIASLLPLVIPPVVLVVGVRTVLGWGPDHAWLQPAVNWIQGAGGLWILSLEYVILALPFTFRALDAGLRTSGVTSLAEASRSLGAGWTRAVWLVLLPALRTSVLNAAFLAFALAFGEFTIASILLYTTFTPWMLQPNSDGQLNAALSLMSLLITWGFLLIINLVGRGRRTKEER